MLGKTYIKTILREITSSFGRFAAIFAIVALGVGFLSGLLATSPNMKSSLNRYFAESNMMDIFIKSTVGLTEEDASAIRALPEIEFLLPAFVTDKLIEIHNETLVARIYGLPLERIHERDFLNRMELLEGRLPQSGNECLVEMGGSFLSSIDIGTVINIIDDDNFFNATQFTVTGIVRSPLFISSEREPSNIGSGRLGAVIYIHQENYSLPAYTDFYITLHSPFPGFSAAYQDFVNTVKGRIEMIGIARSNIRHSEINERLALAEDDLRMATGRAEQELTSARRILDQGSAEISRALSELAEAERKLTEGRLLLAERREMAERELDENESALNRGEAELASARRTLEENGALLENARDEVERHRGRWYVNISSRRRSEIERFDSAVSAYNAGLATLTEQEGELQRARLELNAGRQRVNEEFAVAERELDRIQREINAGRARLTRERQQLALGEEEFRTQSGNVSSRLISGGEELAQARQSADIAPRWYVLDRNANVGSMNFKANVEKISDVARVFPLFFILIAMLVVLTTMTRMIDEERLQIGTLKALGYQKRAILLKYLIYCGITGTLGSVVGTIVGFQILPRIIHNAFGTVYHLPPLVIEFDHVLALVSCAFVIFSVTAATVYACYRSLIEKPTSLLLPRAPKSGKRIFLEYIPFIWNPMKFTHKVTARNLIRQKKHFFMTITGIAGCTALMIAAFGLRDSMSDIARTQFEDILQYDVQIDLQSELSLDELRDRFGGWTVIHSETGYIVSGNQRFNIVIMVPQNAQELSRAISLHNRRTRNPIPFSDTHVVLTERIAEEFNLRRGDTFTIENSRGQRAVFTLSDTTENYVGITAYIGLEAYIREFGNNLSFMTLFGYTGIRDQSAQDSFTVQMLSNPDVRAVEFTSQIQRTYTNLLNSIGFVVLVLIFSAGMLAMIVLYNLTNINISERTREIATLRVLGFHKTESAIYIFREISILSIIGAFIGLGLGIPLHRFIINVAENPDLMFGRNIAALSFILSVFITLFFSAMVNIIMLKKIGSIKMTDSLKAID